MDTVRVSACVDGIAWDALLSWALSWFTSLSFFWTTPLTGTLRVIAEGLAFLNIFARVLNTSLCPFPSFSSVFYGAGSCSA